MSGITFGAGFSVRTSVTVGCAVFTDSIISEVADRASGNAGLVEEVEARVTGETIVGAEPTAGLAARVAGNAGIGGGEVASGRAINHAHVGVGNDAFGGRAGFTIIGIRPVTRFALIRAGETLSAG